MREKVNHPRSPSPPVLGHSFIHRTSKYHPGHAKIVTGRLDECESQRFLTVYQIRILFLFFVILSSLSYFHQFYVSLKLSAYSSCPTPTTANLWAHTAIQRECLLSPGNIFTCLASVSGPPQNEMQMEAERRAELGGG